MAESCCVIGAGLVLVAGSGAVGGIEIVSARCGWLTGARTGSATTGATTACMSAPAGRSRASSSEAAG
eukprot:14425183-Alexandrium_andersonii.AAC.1